VWHLANGRCSHFSEELKHKIPDKGQHDRFEKCDECKKCYERDSPVCDWCGKMITPDNNGMIFNGDDGPNAFYQCNDCHHIEFGVWILRGNLIF